VKQQQEEAWQEQQRHPSEFVRVLRERLEQQRRVEYKENPLLASAGASAISSRKPPTPVGGL